MEIEFLGAVDTVTGSKTLITIGQKKILIDFGLYQGFKQSRVLNWKPFPFEIEEISAVILTHAHIDHSGLIPVLTKRGFQGPIFCTPGTFELCKILLPDSGHIQEMDAERANKFGYSKHHPALPLFDTEEAQQSLQFFSLVEFNKWAAIDANIQFRLLPAGHIIGASMVEVRAHGRTLLFTGDLGRVNDLVMKAPHPIVPCDYLILESTYGDRLHDEKPVREQLKIILAFIHKTQGTLVIPAFAVGRIQLLLFFLNELFAEDASLKLPVYLDSPMGITATKIFCQFKNEHHLDENECKNFYVNTKLIQSVEESNELAHNNEKKVIISASGMATGGRVLNHLLNYAPDPKNAILLSGYQVPGTRGAKLEEISQGHNDDHELKIYGQAVPVKAKVFSLENISAHADQLEILDWLKTIRKPPIKIFLNHGESKSAQALKSKIETDLEFSVELPKPKESYPI